MIDINRITNILTWYANETMQSIINDWDEHTKVKNNEEVLRTLIESLSSEQWLDWNRLTNEDCVRLRFGSWTSYQDARDEIESYNKQIEKTTDEKVIEKLRTLIKREKRIVGLRLIPLWLYPFIPKGMRLTTIFGEEITNDGNLDKETRFNCLAYGIYPIGAMRFEDYEKLEKKYE